MSDFLSDVLPLLTDSYKVGHWKMEPANTTYAFSYIESRGDTVGIEQSVVWDIVYTVKKYLSKPVTMRDVERAKRFADRHLKPGAFNYEGWKRIVTEFNGYLPITITGAKEGSVIPLKNSLIGVSNTHPDFAWVVSYVEPLLLNIWYPITVASLSYQCRQNIGQFWQETVDDDRMGGLDFALHDFGFRGASSVETAGRGGSGHLLSFNGTDTMQAITHLYDYYGLDEEDDASMPAFSVLASEHSVTCANSDCENKEDIDALEMMVSLLEREGGIVSAVADTFNVYRFTERVATVFKDRIIKSGGRFVVRPDSGDARVILPKILEILGEGFGYTINSKGYKVLPDCIRVLQGDGVNMQSINKILQILKDANWSSENIVFGMGGALLQACDRDWLKVAMKQSFVVVDRVEKNIYKSPITDPGKESKRGIQTLYMNCVTGEYKTFAHYEEVGPLWENVEILYYAMNDYNPEPYIRDGNFKEAVKRVRATL
jgi:nicotinamide phosphoribosyltransferase